MADSFTISVCDCHIHVGYFEGNIYFSPKMVAGIINKLGLKKIIVSSTSTIFNDFSIVMKEIIDLVSLSKSEVIPFLWVKPNMLNTSKDLSYYFNLINFKGFKIHPFTDNWLHNLSKLEKIFTIAEQKKLPILLHTGWTPESNAKNFTNLIKKYSGVNVILAHGRPIEQAIEILGNYNNAYIDTAFMETKDIREFVLNSLDNQIIFGSDLPIEKYYYSRISITKHYKRRIDHLIKCFGYDLVTKWSNQNFNKVL